MINSSPTQYTTTDQKTVKQKKPFASPQIVELGSAEVLIQGGGGAGAEDGNQKPHFT